MNWVTTGVAAVVGIILAAVGITIADHEPAHQPPALLGAPTALKRVTVAGPEHANTYRRIKFGDGWQDLDHDGCKTREEIMARDLVNTTRIRGCNVVAGVLHDPYTGRDITYREADSQKVQIDHVVPLGLAWRQGAYAATDAQRVAFANDPVNLLAVDGHENGSKSDQGPSTWLPPNKAFVCRYARLTTTVYYKYREWLRITSADKATLTRVLTDCKGHR